jgi:hypothetical protein
MIANISKAGKQLFPKSQIPNSDGFRLIAVTEDGVRHRCEVIKGADGQHRLDGVLDFSKVIGWTNEV